MLPSLGKDLPRLAVLVEAESQHRLHARITPVSAVGMHGWLEGGGQGGPGGLGLVGKEMRVMMLLLSMTNMPFSTSLCDDAGLLAGTKR